MPETDLMGSMPKMLKVYAEGKPLQHHSIHDVMSTLLTPHREMNVPYSCAASYSAMMFSTGVRDCRLWQGAMM